MRFINEIFAKIREVVPDPKFILSIKINSADYQDGGFSVEDCKKAVEILEQAGVDLIELSGEAQQLLHFTFVSVFDLLADICDNE